MDADEIEVTRELVVVNESRLYLGDLNLDGGLTISSSQKVCDFLVGMVILSVVLNSFLNMPREYL